MKIKSLLVHCSIVGALLIAASPALADEVVDGVIAIVGNDIILLSEVQTVQETRSGRFGGKKRQTQTEVLNVLIDERLIRQEMDRIGIEVTPQEMDQAIRGVLYQNRVTLDQLKAELLDKGISFETYKKELGDQVRLMKFMRQFIYSKVDVSEEDKELYRRRFPQKSKQQTAAEIENAILEVKSRETFDAYVKGIRERSYVEIKKLS